MTRRLLTLFAVVAFASGCNHLRFFPLYSEVRKEQPEVLQLDRKSSDYQIRLAIHHALDDYCARKPSATDACESLRNFTLRKGMDTEQVSILLGPPDTRRTLEQGSELWIYHRRIREVSIRDWYYSRGKLRFEQGVLTDIEHDEIWIDK